MAAKGVVTYGAVPASENSPLLTRPGEPKRGGISRVIIGAGIGALALVGTAAAAYVGGVGGAAPGIAMQRLGFGQFSSFSSSSFSDSPTTVSSFDQHFASDHHVEGMGDTTTDDTMNFFSDGANSIIQHQSIVMGAPDGQPDDSAPTTVDVSSNFDSKDGHFKRLEDPAAPPQPSQECVDHANAFQDTNKFCKPPADGSTNGDPSCTQECFNALAMVETVCGDAKCDDSIAKMECSSFPQHKSAVYDKCTVANPSVFPPGDATTAAADDGTSTADDAATPAPDDDAAHAAKMEEFKKKFKREEMPPASEETPAPPATEAMDQDQGGVQVQTFKSYDEWNAKFAEEHHVKGMEGGDDCSTDDTMSFFNDGADAVMQHQSIVMGSSDGHPTDDSSGADTTANYDPDTDKYKRLEDPNAPPQPTAECVDHANAFKGTFKAGPGGIVHSCFLHHYARPHASC